MKGGEMYRLHMETNGNHMKPKLWKITCHPPSRMKFPVGATSWFLWMTEIRSNSQGRKTKRVARCFFKCRHFLCTNSNKPPRKVGKANLSFYPQDLGSRTSPSKSTQRRGPQPLSRNDSNMNQLTWIHIQHLTQIQSIHFSLTFQPLLTFPFMCLYHPPSSPATVPRCFRPAVVPVEVVGCCGRTEIHAITVSWSIVSNYLYHTSKRKKQLLQS